MLENHSVCVRLKLMQKVDILRARMIVKKEIAYPIHNAWDGRVFNLKVSIISIKNSNVYKF